MVEEDYYRSEGGNSQRHEHGQTMWEEEAGEKERRPWRRDRDNKAPSEGRVAGGQQGSPWMPARQPLSQVRRRSAPQGHTLSHEGSSSLSVYGRDCNEISLVNIFLLIVQ